MHIKTLTIVGVGLIGGSIGLAAKRRGVAERIVGVGRQRGSLDRALAAGVVDERTLDLAAGVHRADIAVFCTPVDQIVEQMAADIVTVCGLPHAHPGIELANAYLTGRATFPAG